MDYKALIEKEISYIKKIQTDQIEELVDVLYNRDIHSKIFTCGMGKAGQIAHTLSTTLSSTGNPSFFIHPSEAQHGDLGMITKFDVIIVISNSGKTTEVIEFIKLTKELYPDIQIYSILGSMNSEISEMSNHTIIYGPVEEICPLELTPTTSTTCMGVICDLIVVGLMELNKFTKENYSKLHHGGYLYKKATGNFENN